MKLFNIPTEVYFSTTRKKLMYTLQAPVEFTLSSGETIIVPEGYVTDFASVPAFARSLVNKDQGFRAAILHDYMYDNQYVITGNERKDRKIADQEFLFQLRIDNVSRWGKFWMYAGVRIGGKSWWEDTTKKSNNDWILT